MSFFFFKLHQTLSNKCSRIWQQCGVNSEMWAGHVAAVFKLLPWFTLKSMKWNFDSLMKCLNDVILQHNTDFTSLHSADVRGSEPLRITTAQHLKTLI